MLFSRVARDSASHEDVPEPTARVPSAILSFSVRRYVRLHAAAIVILVVLCLVGQVAALNFHHDHLGGFVHDFDLDVENNVPTWFESSTLLLAAGLLELVHRTRRRRRHESTHWRALSIGFLLMSIDEEVSLHERLRLPLEMLRNVPAFVAFSWVVPGAILVAAGAMYFVPWLRNLTPRTRRGLCLAGLVYVSGAVGFEAVGGLIAIDRGGLQNWLYVGSYVAEETLEMLGVLILNATLILFLQAHHRDSDAQLAESSSSAA
jgi:hypothetical protein